VKKALNDEIYHTERYPLPSTVLNRMDKKKEQEQQEKWETSTTKMKEHKSHHKRNTKTKTMTRREQAVISCLSTGYSYPFCSGGQRTHPEIPLLGSKSNHRSHSVAF
jgi:hypothetical protein